MVEMKCTQNFAGESSFKAVTWKTEEVRIILILWHIDLLLDKDLKTNNKISDPFLSNDSVKTFLRNQNAHNITVTMETGVFFVVSAKVLKRRHLGQLSSVDRSSIWDLSTEAEE
jgi:hypothetical protein